MKIRDKNIWVVGASSGIGSALTEAFLETGNFVYATARHERSLSGLAKRFPQSLKMIKADITDADDMAALRDGLRAQTDVLDYVVLCAGTCEYDDGPSLNVKMYKDVFDLNFFAQVDCIQASLPMLRKSRGNIVGISSMASYLPFPRAEAYGASKAAFEYFLSSLKIDLIEQHVGVTVVRPGFVDTPLTRKNDFKMPFICDSRTASKKIIGGLEAEKSEINFPWQMVWPMMFFSRFKSIWQNKIAINFKKPRDV